ncbi:MAG TPA: TIM barrel protein [Gaiellaceae bacterium]|nr:TIM barrel protein [Gaiellaceae bacterium]
MDQVLPAAGDDELFRLAARLGFAGVEATLSRQEPDRLEGLVSAQHVHGLAVPSLVLGEHSDLGGVADADPTVAEHARRDVERALDWATELGAEVILVPFFGRAELRDEADLERAAVAFRPLCELAGYRGITLCYEGTLPADRISVLAARIGSRAFGCYFDLANVVVRGMDTATEMRSLGPLIRRVHFKDARVQPGDCPPGLGLVDFRESACALDEIGYDDWVVLETPPGPSELVARDLAFARSVLPRLETGSDWPRLGIFTYDFGGAEWDRLLETCRSFGLHAVQLGTSLLEECLERPEQIPEIRSRFEDADVTVAALAGYRNLVAPDSETRRANLDFLGRCLELAPAFGTSVVATETGTRNPDGDWIDSPDNWRPETWRLVDEALDELLEVAERSGAILALEGHVKNVLRTYGHADGVLERFPTQHLQLVLDPYNYVSQHLLPTEERQTASFLTRFEHRFVLAHLKDVDPAGADAGTIEFGTGAFSQAPYLEFLARRRPDLPMILEHLPLDHVPAAIERVRGLAPTGM